jgi:neutral ceramidase
VISGLANEYVQYFTTPEEYDRQHYEGGSTIYGTVSSNLIRAELVRLADLLARGLPAPAPYPFDPVNGASTAGAPFDTGAASGAAVEQPADSKRLGDAVFRWLGGPRGFDRPLDHPFVSIERRDGQKWLPVTSDLGLQVLWTVDEDGEYTARWEIPLSVPAGTYRFVVTANRYRLASEPFHVTPTAALRLRQVSAPPGQVAVVMEYPQAQLGSNLDADLTWRPLRAQGGVVRFTIGSRTVTVRRSEATVFSVPVQSGEPVRVGAGHARDRYGNTAGEGLTLQN